MARPRQVSDADILLAARETFVEEGPSASVSRVADRVGLSQAALFKRFGSKSQLMIAALAPPEHPAVVAHLNKGPSDEPVRGQLVGIAQMLQEHLRQNVPRIWLLKTAGIPLHELAEHYEVPPVVRLRRALLAWFSRAMEAGLLRTGDPEPMALMLMGSMHARAMLAQLEGAPLPIDADSTWIEQVVDVLWLGIRAPEQA